MGVLGSNELFLAISAMSAPVVVIDGAGIVQISSKGATNIVSDLREGSKLTDIPIDLLPNFTVLRLGTSDLSMLASTSMAQNMAQRGRLESLGTVASGVAHDINNIVTGVLGHVSYLRVILGKDGKHIESLKSIEEGAKRAAALSQQVLKFSKAEELHPTRINAREVTASTLSLIKAAMPPGCSLTSSLPKSGCFVLSIEAQLSQIVMNLVVNARDAVGERGQIEVVVASVTDLDELGRAFHGADLSASSYVRILVADNGAGMSEEVKRRMFEPYFSTKKSNGTGLGLATVNQIVTQFGGAIVVDSVVGRGTTIAVYLPEVGEASVASSSPESALVGGRERILVIDDEYSVRNVLCLSLEHLGYEVLVASSGAEALELYRTALEPISLVLLDMIMPEMPGEKVFAALQELDPDVAVMVVSGFAAGSSIQGILDAGGLDYLPKPFTIEELAKKVRSCFA